jgi:translation initiation factor 1
MTFSAYNKATFEWLYFLIDLNSDNNQSTFMKNSFSSLSELANALGKSQESVKQQTEQISALNSVDNSLVYSTQIGRIKPQQQQKVTTSDGFANVRRETKGRKGKGVIVISGLGLSVAELKKTASKLKKICGSGGSVVGETIEIQGDKRDLIKAELEKQGYKVKFIGG